ncbi:hypothetical protein J2Z31_004629 [Sinorhizobium kostiense]|uniref:Uncharacterized protein n=1 Tax=Sinorhizobium kostiense TaxID=76747 RepID=A0ABS4R5C3_9HYPH|nr:hypothetical protein [Sinorhizobium kostiense]
MSGLMWVGIAAPSRELLAKLRYLSEIVKSIG